MRELEPLWPYPQSVEVLGQFPAPAKLSIQGEEIPEYLTGDVTCHRDIVSPQNGDAYVIKLESGDAKVKGEGYPLSLSASGGHITVGDKGGLSYGIGTFIQIMALCRGGYWPELEITDWPAYRKRCFMVDLGRSVYTIPMLRTGN